MPVKRLVRKGSAAVIFFQQSERPKLTNLKISNASAPFQKVPYLFYVANVRRLVTQLKHNLHTNL